MAKVTIKQAAAAQLAEQCRITYLPTPTHYNGGPEKELRFHPTRDWRFDVAWTNLEQRVDTHMDHPHSVYTASGPKLALEIDGGVYMRRPCPRCKNARGQFGCPICRGAGSVSGGRHNTGKGYEDDVEKLSEALILGWYVFRCLPEQIKEGKTITWLERFFFAHHVVLPHSPRPRRVYPDDPK